MYSGVAQANLGWVEVREGNHEAGLRRCLSSLEMWGENDIYPIQGLGAWPALLVAHGQGDEALCRTLIARLRGPRQQVRPEDVERDLTMGRIAPALMWATSRNFA